MANVESGLSPSKSSISMRAKSRRQVLHIHKHAMTTDDLIVTNVFETFKDYVLEFRLHERELGQGREIPFEGVRLNEPEIMDGLHRAITAENETALTEAYAAILNTALPGTVKVKERDIDVAVKWGKYYDLIMEVKVDEGQGDAFSQAFLYYQREVLKKKIISPCLIVTARGLDVKVYGAVCLGHDTFLYTRLMSCCDISEMRECYRFLYSITKTVKDLRRQSLSFPPLDHFSIEINDSEMLQELKADKRFLFKGKLGGERVIMKMAQRYGYEVHDCLQRIRNGYAPKILKCFKRDKYSNTEMIVMEDLVDSVQYTTENFSENECKGIHLKLTWIVEFMHKSGFVHGNLRESTILVTKSTEEESTDFDVKLVGFSWSGCADAVRYPLNINKSLFRCVDVRPGLPIRKEHDLYQLRKLDFAM